jgi:hypothetical protein
MAVSIQTACLEGVQAEALDRVDEGLALRPAAT